MQNFKSFILKYGKWIIFSFCIINFFVVAIFVKSKNEIVFDKIIYYFVIYLKCDLLTVFYKIISFFASKIFIVLLCIAILIFDKDKKRALFIILCIVISTIFNVALKYIFQRKRPIEISLVNENSYSFPSGHSMASMSLYGIIIYLINKQNFKKNIKIIIISLFMTLIFLIGVSRIYLGVHYATDVLAGFLFSLSYLIIYIYLCQKIKKQIENSKTLSDSKR